MHVGNRDFRLVVRPELDTLQLLAQAYIHLVRPAVELEERHPVHLRDYRIFSDFEPNGVGIRRGFHVKLEQVAFLGEDFPAVELGELSADAGLQEGPVCRRRTNTMP